MSPGQYLPVAANVYHLLPSSLQAMIALGVGVTLKRPVTIDPGSSPYHDKLGVELGKVKCLLGGGGTHRTYKDGTKPYYKRAPCYLNPYRQEGDERKFYDV